MYISTLRSHIEAMGGELTVLFFVKLIIFFQFD